MGFTTGFLGGVTLTTSILYLASALHTQTRARQRELLRQQRLVLYNIVDPQPEIELPTRREVQVGVVEQAKDGWNRELEKAVRWAQEKDWALLRQGLEEDVARLWSRVKASTEKKAGEVVEKATK
ncbi:hypothetical protein EJ05DRAFT_509299 [Pseudovirgaria hyperparasitica]|uniref:MICOS complex subunit MIC12 n=1 Tax=Pseudovirgaria hyperparasitica TaxID=470096 RepID=A0A6A6WEM1_9PEZI|nr:uncharacterized protein EJ05DRAFT_509299 [Pseudovirgaria hyperparasitica]KAF2759561.1 hypothetical protein EJ05DRAFT_509299 [Pseudovirgaria hyperparasitica]